MKYGVLSGGKKIRSSVIINTGKLFNLNIHLVSDFKILEYIFGLIFIGFFGIIINFITNINDFITLSTMTFGAFLYFLFFIKTKNKKNEIYFILLLVFVSFFFFRFPSFEKSSSKEL